jgi:hypothetical protein
MLVPKSYQPNDIITLKLVNGEELVARYMDKTVTHWILERPLMVMASNQGVALIQSLISADINKNVEINSEHVIMHSQTVQQMVDHYIQTTTGIQTVSKGAIIT